MKLFKKLMAGAMAIAMLSAYTVALANENQDTGDTSTAKIEGSGSYAGNATALFRVQLPTAADSNAKVAFTVDPNEVIKGSKPADAGDDSTFGTVFFKQHVEAVEADPSNNVEAVPEHDAYKSESEPLEVINKSSVDVTVNMFASLSDTKMTLVESDSFSDFAQAATEHLYLGVKVTTDSTTTSAIGSLGAKNATSLATVATNFTTTVVDGKYTMVERTLKENQTPADELDDWNKVSYVITGKANPNADWAIEGIDAPTLTIKWVVDPANVITTAISDPADTAPADYDAEANGSYVAAWTAKLDKAAYKVGETVTLYVKPTDASKKVKSVTFDYVSLNSKNPTVTDKVVNLKTTLGETVVNGVYAVTFTLPDNMAKSTTPTGTGATAYTAPTFTITLS